jgi:glycyl-tRNA synthetase
MLNLYDLNNVPFWTDQQIQIRRMMETVFTASLARVLKEQNPAFQMIRVEAPLLTPRSIINPNYTDDDVYAVGRLALRPETTMGSYAYAEHLLNPHRAVKWRLPFVVWQHGKSFRREQDQPTRFVRLKEFHQLEYQILFAESTKNDYAKAVVPSVGRMIESLIGPCVVEPSDRVPHYAEWTQDVICRKSDMEVCSMSMRRDFPKARNLEVAIGTDRCVYNFERK